MANVIATELSANWFPCKLVNVITANKKKKVYRLRC